MNIQIANSVRHTSLKCLAARVVHAHGLDEAAELPPSLHHFISQHWPATSPPAANSLTNSPHTRQDLGSRFIVNLYFSFGRGLNLIFNLFYYNLKELISC